MVGVIIKYSIFVVLVSQQRHYTGQLKIQKKHEILNNKK